jgi:hypothetical protein
MAHIINFETSIRTAHDNALADEAEEETEE